MNPNYVYFISSLPVLFFGTKPQFTIDDFIKKLESYATPKDIDIVKNLPDVNDCNNKYSEIPIIQKWIFFETLLRNELVKIRAERKKIDPLKYLKTGAYPDLNSAHIVIASYRNPHLLDGEKYFDQERFNYLGELSIGHYFDIEFLIIYAYKLKILNRWQKIQEADKLKLLEETIEKIKN